MRFLSLLFIFHHLRPAWLQAAASGMLVMLVAQPAAAQQVKTAAQFLDLKAKYQLHLASIRPQYEVLEKRLAEVERKFAAERNYEAAKAIQQERVKLAAENGVTLPETKGPAATSELDDLWNISLPISKATLAGGVYLDNADGLLLRWQTVGVSASWEITSPAAPGAYLIEANYATDNQSGGCITFSDGKSTCTKVFAPTDNGEDLHVAVVGTLRLDAGSRKFQISVESATGTGAWILKSLRLVAPTAQ